MVLAYYLQKEDSMDVFKRIGETLPLPFSGSNHSFINPATGLKFFLSAVGD